MILKDLYNWGTPDQVYDVMHEYLIKPDYYRSKFSFEDYLEELDICPMCGEINERDKMTYHVWDMGNTEELICESCRNDEEM